MRNAPPLLPPIPEDSDTEPVQTVLMRSDTRFFEKDHSAPFGVCVFITAGPITKLFARGGGGEWRTCAMRDDEPRPVWMSPLITH